jgi:hypothetical protein
VTVWKYYQRSEVEGWTAGATITWDRYGCKGKDCGVRWKKDGGKKMRYMYYVVALFVPSRSFLPGKGNLLLPQSNTVYLPTLPTHIPRPPIIITITIIIIVIIIVGVVVQQYSSTAAPATQARPETSHLVLDQRQ